MKKTITLKDIAVAAGVSKTTASYAFSDHPDSSSETKQKVLDVARELDYRPNHIAQALKTKQTKTVGVVFTNALGVFMGEIVRGIEEVIYGHGYHMLICTCNDDQGREKSHVDMLLHKKVDGLIVFMVTPKRGGKFDYSHLTDLKKKNVPLVFIDRYLPNEDIDYVVTDGFAGAYEAVSHLISLGHRRIAYMSKSDDSTSVSNRLEGYKKALVDAGIEVKDEYLWINEYASEGDPYRVAVKKLQIPDRPTAIFTATGEATEVLQAIREQGLCMPEDIALIDFGNQPAAAALDVPLTVVNQPMEELGQKAAEVLIEKIEHRGQAELKQISIKPKLIIRKSCGAVESALCAT